jgi:hypothetical protein
MFSILSSYSLFNRSILTFPILISYLIGIKAMKSHGTAVTVGLSLSIIGIVSWLSVITLVSLFFNDCSLKPTLPWGAKPFDMEMYICVQKLFIVVPFVWNSNISALIWMLLSLLVGILSYISFLRRSNNSDKLCKVVTLSYISVSIWLSAGVMMLSIIKCGIYHSLLFFAFVPGLVYILNSIKNKCQSSIVEQNTKFLSDEIYKFTTYFSFIVDCYLNKNSPESAANLMSLILKHKVNCKDTLCPCRKINTSTLGNGSLVTIQRSVFFEKSASIDIMKGSNISFNIEDDKATSESSDDNIMAFLIYQAKYLCKYGLSYSLPYLYCGFLHLYIKENYYTAIYQLEKSQQNATSLFIKFSIFHTRYPSI